MNDRNLKNWTITAKSVKNGLQGLTNYANYLQSQSDHNNQKITVLNNGIGKMSLFAETFNLKKKLNGKKGGRPSNHGWSNVLSYPMDISDNDFKVLVESIYNKFYHYVIEENNIDFSSQDLKYFMQSLIAIIHRGENVHNHAHVIVPKHFKTHEGIVSIDLTKKKYLNRLKLINNEVVNEKIGYSISDYNIKSSTEHRKKKSQLTYFRDKLKDENNKLSELNNKIESIINEVELLRDEIIYELENDQIEKEEAERQLKIADRALAQAHNNNTDRSQKSINKLRTMRR